MTLAPILFLELKKITNLLKRLIYKKNSQNLLSLIDNVELLLAFYITVSDTSCT